MLPTFVIGLREGLEAALIVGIIAAFLRRQGRGDLLRQMAIGVGLAIGLCVLVGVGLEVWSRELPQREQEALETVIGALAVAMVTYMVVWMRNHSRGLKHQLEGMAAEALADKAGRAGRAMVFMAFLAVLREGFETAVFLLAAFNETGSGASALVGAVLGIAVAVVLGYGIYRGGVRINLSKFFRATGLVLVLVAAGLVVSALHTAHEAGWLNVGQQHVLDLDWLVRPGSVLSSLLTGMLGIQPQPVLAEVIGWLVYVVPVGLFVAWPPGRAVPLRGLVRGLSLGAVAGVGAAVVLAVAAPANPAQRPSTSAGDLSARVVATHGDTVTVRTEQPPALTDGVAATRDYRLTRAGSTTVDGVSAEVYRVRTFADGNGPARLPLGRVAQLNGGHLPIGVKPGTADTLPVHYRTARTLQVAIEPRTSRVLDLGWTAREQALVDGPAGSSLPLATPFHETTEGLHADTTAHAAATARAELAAMDRRETMTTLAWLFGCLGVAAALAALGLERRRRVAAAATVAAGVTEPTPHLARH